MSKWLAISTTLHLVLLALIVWSDRFSFLISKNSLKQQASGVVQVDLAYKPTDTPMRRGIQKKDLPPPDVAIPKKSEPDRLPNTKQKSKKAQKKDDKAPTSKDFKNIFDKLRQEARQEDRPLPKLDNFPMTEKGDKQSLGTGGRSQRTLSPAELALQSAMRKYFEMPEAGNIRKKYPGISGYIQVYLVSNGDQFVIRSLKFIERTGLPVLDQSCEQAVRRALDTETFSADVVAELNGKESGITCTP
jgi:hypothetical protein